jgi:hypothetical protein
MSYAPPDSFLPYNAHSLEGVIQQVENSPQLQQRYAKHFNIPPDQVVDYFRANLVESYITETRRYPVWCVRPDGRRYLIHQTFRRGERVLALRNGEPVLKWACGNPLTTTLPAVQVVERPRVLPSREVRERVATLDTPFETPRELVAAAPAYGLAPAAMLVPAAAAAPIVPIAAAAAPAVFPWWVVPPLLIAAAPGPGVTGPPGPPPPEVIPEAGTLALLGAGLLAVAAAGRRRRKAA